MGYLVIGFILGVAVSWFWQNQHSGKPAFQQLMKKELAANGQMGTVANLKKRLEMMEKRLAEMENSTVDDEAVQKEKPGSVSEGISTGPALTLINKEGKNSNRMGRTERAHNCDKAMLYWNEGKSVTDIASITGLGKGEIELIVSLKNSSHDAGTGSGKA